MKKVFYALLTPVLLFAGIGVLYSRMQPPCSQPVSYSIGAIDPRFHLTKDTALKQAKAAEALWEKAAGKNLFDYSSTSPFKINFIYDDRQARTDELAQIAGNLKTTKNQFDSIGEQATTLSKEYDTKHAAYQDASMRLQSDLDAYNKEVDKWNSEGGAPESEYKKLQAEKDALNKRSVQLENNRQSLNALASQINSLASEGHNIA